MVNQPHLSQLDNGCMICVEPMLSARTVTCNIRINAGSVCDLPGRWGLASLTESTVGMGCKGVSHRRLLNLLDDYGADRESYTSAEYTNFSFTCLPEYFENVLRTYSRVIRSPSLAKSNMATCRKLQCEAIFDLDDSPARLVSSEVCRAAIGDRLGRHALGDADEVDDISESEVRAFWKRHYRPDEVQISVAGGVEVERVLRGVDFAFADWSTKSATLRRSSFRPAARLREVDGDHEQTHLCYAFSTASRQHPLYYAGILYQTILAGGSSSKLSREVRDKRGLAYDVHGFYKNYRQGALMMVYAATSREKESDCRHVCEELLSSSPRVTSVELKRAKAIARGNLLTTGSLPDARAAALANDMFLARDARSLDDLADALERVRLSEIRDFVEEFPGTPHSLAVLR